MTSLIIDGHCDVLYKMYENEQIDFFASHEARLDASYARLKQGGIKLQLFAVYLAERINNPQFDHYLEYIHIFNEKICSDDRMMPVRTKGELRHLMASPDKTGAMLTLEGADAVAGNPLYLKTLFYLGVRMIGLTWNYGNWAADGVLEPRRGGLTRKGARFVKECNQQGILLDVSHLSERSFWDLASISASPFAASHSNAKALCSHPRNLDDSQLREIIRRGGITGVTFVPWFLKKNGRASIDDVMKHIDHICSLGGQHTIALGSDFDGIEQWTAGLEHAGCGAQLAEELCKRYGHALAGRFLWGNWHDFLMKHLPD